MWERVCEFFEKEFCLQKHYKFILSLEPKHAEHHHLETTAIAVYNSITISIKTPNLSFFFYSHYTYQITFSRFSQKSSANWIRKKIYTNQKSAFTSIHPLPPGLLWVENPDVPQ